MELTPSFPAAGANSSSTRTSAHLAEAGFALSPYGSVIRVRSSTSARAIRAIAPETCRRRT
jgi:hypothetical protein